MFTIGLNPYGLAYTVGLQSPGLAESNDQPVGLAGFIAIARDIGARCIELDWRWLTVMSNQELFVLRQTIAGMTPVCSFWLTQQPRETLAEAIRCAVGIGAPLVRLHLTPVLEGDRAKWGVRWAEMVDHGRAVIVREAAKAADAGLELAIENHQDLGSEELVALAEEAGQNVGVVLDTGNPFAVGEDPVAFARRAADRIRHVHLKDYCAQFTAEGCRLVRCAVGDGCVPFAEIAAVLTRPLTASIEIGALEARHIRLFTPRWWNGYPPREPDELKTALGRLRQRSLDPDVDWRTPWERGGDRSEVMGYELAQLNRSVEHLRAIGWM